MSLTYHKVKTQIGDIFVHLNSDKSLHFTSDNSGNYVYRQPVIINGNDYRVSGHYECNGSEWKMCNTFSINKINTVKVQDYSKSARDKAIAAIEEAIQFFVHGDENRHLFEDARRMANENRRAILMDKITEKEKELKALRDEYDSLG